MRRRTTAVIVAVLVVGSLAAFPMAGLAAQTTESTDTATNDTADENASVAPGEQLAGVVGVQEAEIEGEVDSRAYGIRVAQSASNDSKAAVAGEQLDDVEQRLDELEDRRAALDEARENGSMSEGQYRARMAKLNAETRTAERLTNQTNETAQTLPVETLEANGVNASAIKALSDRANELRGPEVAEIARSIAGEGAGNGFGPDRAGERGADRGAEADNETDGADRGNDARDGGDTTDTTTDQGQNETTADEQGR
jgi:hypothetical protein